MAFHALNYPIYTASFDPHNSDFLFVGGGGGESRSGVPNKISLLDTSLAAKNNELREVTHIDLSRDEDSVSSLAVAKSDAKEATLFAGINSSQKEQEAGNNDHLRAVKVPYPQRSESSSDKPTATIPPPSALSKASFFTPSDAKLKETYQRILRLSPATKTSKKRLGAVATGLAPEGEIVLFDASSPTPSKRDIVQRISVGKGEEPGDVDIFDKGNSEFRAVYCTDGSIYCVDVKISEGAANGATNAPFRVFEGSKVDGSFRSIRFLTKNLALAVRNFPRKRGAQIMIFQVPNEPVASRPIYISALPHGFNAATSLDAASLPALDDSDKRQYLVATSGQNGTIVLYTLDYTPNQGRKLLLKKHSIYRDIHPAGITYLAFSNFALPTTEVPNKPIRVKLASTSFGNSVVVHTLPLKPRPTPRKPSYMVLATPPQRSAIDDVKSYFTGAIIIAILSAFVYTVGELSGNIKTERLGIRKWAPNDIKDLFGIPRESGHPIISAPVVASSMPPLEPGAAARAASRAAERADASAETLLYVEEFTQHIPEVASQVQSAAAETIQDAQQGVAEAKDKVVDDTHEKIKNILKAHQDKDDSSEYADAPAAVMFRDSPSGLKFSTHEEEQHAEEAGAKKWEDLSEHQQHLWRRRLKQAGHWAEGETETILKGIFFGTIAGMVGAAAHG